MKLNSCFSCFLLQHLRARRPKSCIVSRFALQEEVSFFLLHRASARYKKVLSRKQPCE
jgi:hypothetical protein